MEDMADFVMEKTPGAAIKVIGVGGGGGNAVNHMFKHGIRDVDFVICNTDAQAMEASAIRNRVQLGASLTEGRGAGNKPEVGRQAAIENIEDVKKTLSENTKMVFVTAGMGGGTGTGAAPVIAQCCKEQGYLTVAIVTIPFRNEGKRRIKQAYEGIKELATYVDSLLVINNERIREMFGDFGISEAFAKADNVLSTAAKGIAEIITVPGYINVDFADVETVMRKSGMAVMGTGVSDEEDRAEDAVRKALNSPLLNDNEIRGARNILVNINSGNKEVTMDEVGRITDYVQNMAGFDADLIWGNGKDESLGDKLSVTVIATGFPTSIISELSEQSQRKVVSHKLEKETVSATKDDQFSEQKNEENRSQSTFEFNVTNNNGNDDDEFENLYPITSRERNSAEKEIDVNDYANLSDDDVDELENVPAFKRRNIRINDPKYKRDRSGYSVGRDNRISDRNSYLHDNVD
ncbi:cell division protein FtsZ [Draconibacterium sp. IB214405]|uniref:cell division protein FtsZ n=1 Tax=Draconibacterium sp. IB214405 TaxID=3097352 RepID=UPI002A0AC09E|nr:cell division protein FtsZ [Draconibacterium sp. IB214405]MDX8338592.1 cell division protein FtsZ [Draconibacterium sp. IB214405]